MSLSRAGFTGKQGVAGNTSGQPFAAGLRSHPPTRGQPSAPGLRAPSEVSQKHNSLMRQIRLRADAAEDALSTALHRVANLELKLVQQANILSSRTSSNRTRDATIAALQKAKNNAEGAAREAIKSQQAALRSANNAVIELKAEQERMRKLLETTTTTVSEKNRIKNELASIQRNLTSAEQQRNLAQTEINNVRSELNETIQIATNEVAKRNRQIANLASKIQEAEKKGESANRERNSLQQLLEQVKTEATKYMNNANKNRNAALAEAAAAKNAAAKIAANKNAEIAEIRKKVAATRLLSVFRLKKQLATENAAKRITQSAINSVKNAQNKEAAAVERANAATANSAAQKNALVAAQEAHEEQMKALNRARQAVQENRNKALAAKKAAEAAKAAGNIELARQKENYARQLQNLAARHTAELSDATKRANAIQRNYHAALSSIETTRGKQTELNETIKSKNTEIARLIAQIASQNTASLQRNAEIANLQRKEKLARNNAAAAAANSKKQRNALAAAKIAHAELVRSKEEQLRQTRIEKTEANAALAKAKRNTEAANARAEEASRNAASQRSQAATNRAAKATANAEVAKAREELAVAQSKAAAADVAAANAEMRGSASNAARQAANEARARVQLELENLKKVYATTVNERKKAIGNLATITQEINSLKFKSAANIQRLQNALQVAQSATTTAQKANVNRQVAAAKKRLDDSRKTFRKQITDLKRQLANAKRTGQPAVIVQQFASTLEQAEKQNRSIYKNMASADLVREIRKLTKNIVSAKSPATLPPPGPDIPPPPLPARKGDIARAKRNLMYQLLDQLDAGTITVNNIRRRIQKPEFNEMIENLSELEKTNVKFRTYGNRMNKILIPDVDIETARKAYNTIKELLAKLPIAQNKSRIRDLILAQYRIAIAKKNDLGYNRNIEVRRVLNAARNAVSLSARTGNVFREIPLALRSLRNTASINARIRNLKVQYNKASLTNQPKILAQIKQLMAAKNALAPPINAATQVTPTKPINVANFNKVFNNARYKSDRIDRIREFARLMNRYKAPTQRQKLRDEATATVRKLYRNAGYGASKKEIFQDLLDAKRAIGGRNSNVNREISVALRRIEDEIKAKNRGRTSSINRNMFGSRASSSNIRPLMAPSGGAPPMITYPSAGAAPAAVYPGGAQVIPAAGPGAPPGISIKIGEGKTTVPTPVIAEAASQIPVGERAAINAAGGLRAVNTAANMGGGAVNVTQAAMALNKAGGNVAQARANTGLPMAAFNAVNKLGGANRAIVAVRGLKNIEKRVARRKRGKKFTVSRSKLALVVHKLKRKNIDKMVIGWIVKEKPKKKKTRRVRKA